MDLLLKRIQRYKLWHSFCKVLVFNSRVILEIEDFRNLIIFVHLALNINHKNNNNVLYCTDFFPLFALQLRFKSA